MDFEKELKVERTNIPGLIVFDLPVHGDNRGWFKENWQRAKMTALGLPDFGPVQNNISFNAKKGVTRGIHAEPWDKYISIATGAVFGAWVDLRPGESFGQVYTTRLDPSKAIYVPRGVGNSFQALEDGTAYTYLVNAHWSLEQKKTYTFVNLADPELDIQWPIPLEESERSEADLHHPMLRDARPMAPRRTMVTGCNGQLGHAIRDYVEEHGLEGFEFNDIDTFDFSDPAQYDRFDWSLYGTIINAGAYTAVDRAETPEGRPVAWKANAQGPALLARVAHEHNITLVHVSSDYVFDGTAEEHDEEEAFAPLGVYGQTKAAGVNMPYVSERWLGGMLTNFQTVSKRVSRLKELEEMDFSDVHGSGLTKKELLLLEREKDKLEKQLGGIRNMVRTPSAMFVVDINKESLAVEEAHKLGIPVVALVDTNTDPESVDYPIPANDDAIRGIELLTSLMADAVADGLLERSGRAAKAEGETEAEQPMAAWEKELLTEGASAEAAPAAEAEEAKAE